MFFSYVLNKCGTAVFCKISANEIDPKLLPHFFAEDIIMENEAGFLGFKMDKILEKNKNVFFSDYLKNLEEGSAIRTWLDENGIDYTVRLKDIYSPFYMVIFKLIFYKDLKAVIFPNAGIAFPSIDLIERFVMFLIDLHGSEKKYIMIDY